jgi:tetratricopeptide (TPR) repeat protein
MGAGTYPDEKVVQFINQHLVPVRLPHDRMPENVHFHVKWTPTVLLLDAEGEEHHRKVGFLSPTEFIPALLLGIGKVRFDDDRLEEALNSFKEVLARYPDSDSAPEALYYRGVCLYKMAHDPGRLKETGEELEKEYPQSEWTKRAFPYRLL